MKYISIQPRQVLKVIGVTGSSVQDTITDAICLSLRLGDSVLIELKINRQTLLITPSTTNQQAYKEYLRKLGSQS
jgi:hypothetical protein